MTADCFCQGTLILTARGEMPVETLAVGTTVVTASGKRRAVRWVGHREFNLTKQPKAMALWPVRIQANAFREGQPSRDLWLSPGHCVFVDNVLVPVRTLINRASIAQVPAEQVIYWHVELDRHDILVADGLPAESYLDVGNRGAFDNDGAADKLDPAYEDGSGSATCAPVVKAGPDFDAIKERLLERTAGLGYRLTSTNDLHAMADGTRVDAIDLGGKRLAFVLPAACASIQLVSRTFVPWQMLAKSTDGRLLGVCIKRLQIDGKDIDLTDKLPTDAWHGFEMRPNHVQRWTKGVVGLPRNARIIIVELGGDGRYWEEGAASGLAPVQDAGNPGVANPAVVRRVLPRRDPATRS